MRARKRTVMKIGQEAPHFSLDTYNGSSFRLADRRGSKLWLSFFRYSACPLCNLRIQEMIDHFDVWKSKGLRIVAVFQSPVEKIGQYVGRQNPPFPLLADPAEAVYDLYGVNDSVTAMMRPALLLRLAKALTKGFLPGIPDGTLTRIPADFLIDETGHIGDMYYGRDIGDHIPFERVNRFL